MSVLVAKVRKNAKEELRISVDRWRGLDLVNLRVWFQAPLDLAALVDLDAEARR